MHDGGDRLAPRWVVLLDTDEFLWAREAGEIGLPEALEARSTTCCLQVCSSREKMFCCFFCFFLWSVVSVKHIVWFCVCCCILLYDCGGKVLPEVVVI